MIAYQNKDVETYVATLTPLQQELMLAMREAVLVADTRVKESIKWGSIAFSHQSNICGFRVAKGHVTLLFMEGSSLTDSHGVLEGTGPKARTYKFDGKTELNTEAIQDLVQQALANGQ